MPSADYSKGFQCYQVALTAANTEYSLELPEGTKHLTIQAQDATAVRIAFETGKVAGSTAPYYTLKANGVLQLTGAFLNKATLYAASAGTTKVLEVIAGS